MDKAAPPGVYSPEMVEEERRRRVSCDPFAKPSPASQQSEQYLRAEKTRLNTNPYFWPQAAATTPKWENADVFYGPNPKSLPTGNAVDAYGLYPASNFSLSKPPVPESGQNLQSQPNVNWYSKNSDTDTGEIPPSPTPVFLKTHFLLFSQVVRRVLELIEQPAYCRLIFNIARVNTFSLFTQSLNTLALTSLCCFH